MQHVGTLSLLDQIPGMIAGAFSEIIAQSSDFSSARKAMTAIRAPAFDRSVPASGLTSQDHLMKNCRLALSPFGFRYLFANTLGIVRKFRSPGTRLVPFQDPRKNSLTRFDLDFFHAKEATHRGEAFQTNARNPLQ